jgi:hypothetical protein
VKILLTLLIAFNALGQTQVDLKLQTKNIDFSGAATVSPFPVGFNLPAACTTGNMFFKSNAPTGANLYGCVATNSWSLESGGSSGGGTGGSGASIPLLVERVSGTDLAIGQACIASAPCMVGIGASTYSFLAGATVTVSAGSGLVLMYVDRNGTLTVGEGSATTPSITCTNCTVANGITQFPPDSIPLANWTATSGVWDMTGTDARAILTAGRSFTAGPNVSITEAGSNVTISASLSTLTSGVRPACSAITRGTLWYTPGMTGIQDNVAVCAKDMGDAYAWRTLY